MNLLLFPTPAELDPRPVRANPKAALATYLSDVYPARGHGATDCGEMLDGLSDADHMIQWLAERGLALVSVKGRSRA